MSAHLTPGAELDTCGCCEQPVPRARVYNRPGLDELEYRIGVHGTFLRRMLALLPNWPPRLVTVGANDDGPDPPPLSPLTTRAGDDPSIAILDAWATLADVLTFYQERIANEGFLRTATERRSVLELARTIGYELNPGVAAATFLAFTVEDREPPPGIPPVLQSVVAKGTKVQSMPTQGQLPQTFETSAELVARPEFNELRPRLTLPQPVSLGSTELFVAGVATGLDRGDRILITGPPQDPDEIGVQTSVLEVTSVEPEAERTRTRILLAVVPKLPPPARPPAPTPTQPVTEFDFTPPDAPPIPAVAPPEIDPPVFALVPRPLTEQEIAQRILEYHWNNALLVAQLGIFGWGIGALIDHIRHRRFELDLGPVFEWVPVVPARDTKRPTVVSVFPPNGAENVHPETIAMVTFSEPMDEASAKAASKLFDGTQEITTVTKTYRAATGTVELDPNRLDPEKTYTIVVEVSATDTAVPGNPLAAEFRSGFKVVDFTPPQVVERYPDPDPNADPDKDTIDVPVNAEIKVTFSEDVQGADETSLYLRDSTGLVVPADVALTNQKKTVVLTPKRPLALSTQYTVTMTSEIKDVPASTTGKPNPAKAEEWTFTTADRPRDAPAKELAVYAFRERAAFFGHNAPKWESLQKPTLQNPQRGDDPYPHPWDVPLRPVWVDSQGSSYGGDTVYLDRPVPSLEPRSWTIFESVDGLAPYFVTKVAEESIADYGISGRGSRLTLSQRDGTSPSVGVVNPPDFKTRQTAALVASERLALVELPIEQPLAKGDTEILLDEMVVGLTRGQPIALRGELVDLPGVIGDEIVLLEDSFHSGGFTNLVLQAPLERSYVRKTATLNANVVAATHGETVLEEILGGGDGSQPNQRFALKKPPLTYVSAPTPSGSESTMELRVDGVLWTEAPNLYELGPREERYIVRVDEDGTTRAIFGDGDRGARPPTGAENIRATYRSGIGSPGLVGDERLTLLQQRPLGIQTVTNPLPPTGAEDREDRDSARVNAPLTVLTMDRIVSLSDFEDFARAFAGIGKAQAVAFRRGESQFVHLTVAAANGDEVARTSTVFKNLIAAIESSRDPGVDFAVDSYARMYFNIAATLLIDARFTPDAVLAVATAVLEETFSFKRRAFGQPVTAAEVVTVLQNVAGVVAVDLDELYRVDEDAPATAVVGLDQVIWVDRARLDGSTVLPAQLLMVNPGGMKLSEGTT